MMIFGMFAFVAMASAITLLHLQEEAEDGAMHVHASKAKGGLSKFK